MEQHQDVVLQQRVGATPVERDRHDRARLERVGGTEADEGEERTHHEHHDQRPGDQRVVGPFANRQATAAVNAASTNTHNRIEPSRALHMAATL